MRVGVEALFTSALGVQAPWAVKDVKLHTVLRIYIPIGRQGTLLACPVCRAGAQSVNGRLRPSWQHLDFFQFEAWLHCDVPRVACGGCGKSTQVAILWARPGSGFTATFEPLALALYLALPARQAAALLRCEHKPGSRLIGRYLGRARAHEDFPDVRQVGIDEVSPRKEQNYLTVGHQLDAYGLLFAIERRTHKTALDFATNLKAHSGDPTEVRQHHHNSREPAAEELKAWLSWARHSWLTPFKMLAATLKERLAGAPPGKVDHRSDAFAKAINGRLQQAKRATRGFSATANLIAIAYLRMSRIKHLPASPFAMACMK